MLTRYIRTLFWLGLGMAVVVLVPLGLLALRGRLSDELILVALCLWGAAVGLGGLLLWAWLVASIWFFPGTGDAIPEERLRAKLLAINERPGPVRATTVKKHLMITWNYRDPHWCEMLSRQGQRTLYELRLRFDAVTRTVILMDRVRRSEFLFCPEGVTIGRARIPMPVLRVRLATAGSLEDFASAEAYECSFRAREIKGPIMAAILAAGWNVRFALW